MYNRTFFGEYVNLYGISIAVGILVCFFVLRYLGKKQNVDTKFMNFVEVNGYVAIVFGFFTAALFQAVYEYIEGGSVPGTFDLFNSGITFIGGLIGGASIFIVIYVIKKNSLTGRIVDILPFVPCCIAVAHAFGRVGCFFAGCCNGRHPHETDVFKFLAINFPPDSQYSGLRYPTQLFEAIFLFILFGIMFYLLVKKKFIYNFPIYLSCYGTWRFFIEFLRGDDRGQFIGSISPSQFWSIIMVLLAIPCYFLIKYLFKKRETELALMKDTE
jgi:phosphatidylglycerol:prolipoprotein diacylglycerol transferase